VTREGAVWARLHPPTSTGLSWPRGHQRLSPPERARLLHYERLMGLAHLTVLPIALAAALTHLEASLNPSPGPTVVVAVAALGYAVVYHLLLPRVWLSHAKVVLGLCLDTALVSVVVHLSGGQSSVLVFLYYLIVIMGALTLESRALYGICAVVSAGFCLVLPFDPGFAAAPGANLVRAVVFVLSVWLVGFMSATGAAQIQRAERRLLEALHRQEVTARENASLTRELATQLEESRALSASLAEQRETTRRLADMVLRAQEEERRRVARELHDEANQTLAAVMTAVDMAEARVADTDDAELAATLARLRRLTATALADLQRIAVELRPPALDEFGLVAALSKHVAERTAGTALCADVRIEGRRRRLPGGVEVALYRIAQEALANAQKHSRASLLHIRLRFLPGAVRLDISDNGCGFGAEGWSAPAAEGDARARLGIAGMRERAAIVGGTVEISSRPGGGTRVSAQIPAADVEASDAGGAVA
jgi:signal transduction histidine kinase